jgi:mono/diheme cytochrome c family protein
MKILVAMSLGLALACASAAAQQPAPPSPAAEDAGPHFPAEQIRKGSQLFTLHCATCHGTRMRNPQWAFDLRTFPRDGHARFVDSVSYGKGAMPSWDDVLGPDDIEALWAYVVDGEPED